MVSLVQDDNFQYWWEPQKWKSKFKVHWWYVKDINYSKFYHLKLDSTDGQGGSKSGSRTAVRVRDGTEIPWKIGKEMIQIFRDAPDKPNLFEFFNFLDIREDVLRTYRTPKPGNMFNPYMMMMSQMQFGGGFGAMNNAVRPFFPF
jgi:hypothetical protein